LKVLRARGRRLPDAAGFVGRDAGGVATASAHPCLPDGIGHLPRPRVAVVHQERDSPSASPQSIASRSGRWNATSPSGVAREVQDPWAARDVQPVGVARPPGVADGHPAVCPDEVPVHVAGSAPGDAIGDGRSRVGVGCCHARSPLVAVTTVRAVPWAYAALRVGFRHTSVAGDANRRLARHRSPSVPKATVTVPCSVTAVADGLATASRSRHSRSVRPSVRPSVRRFGPRPRCHKRSHTPCGRSSYDDGLARVENGYRSGRTPPAQPTRT
jgi:hypothetical protein